MDKIYFDCDGVLANFEKFLIQTMQVHYWERAGYGNELWDELGKIPNLYSQLEVLPDAWTLFAEVFNKYGPDKVEILTATPPPVGLLNTAALDKECWIYENINNEVNVNTVRGGRNKYQLLADNPGSLLIDDCGRNLEIWHTHGGVGILHKDVPSTFEKLRVLKIL